MSALNAVILIGRLTKDPELRYTQSGKAVCRMRLAVDRGTAGPEGEKQVDFIDIIAWEKLAENCTNHLAKGRLVCVQGRLQVRQIVNPETGARREKAEVVAYTVRFLDWGKSGQSGNGENGQDGAPSMGEEFEVDDEDVPF